MNVSPITFAAFSAFFTAALSKIIYCIVILIVSAILVSVLNKVLKNILSSKASILDSRKAETLHSVGSNIIKIIVYFIAACSILTQFGIS